MELDLPECPYCYATVMFRPDGSCPACGKDVNKAPPENFNYSAVEITPDQSLPACCMACGSDTEQVELFEYEYDSHLRGDWDENSYFAFTLLTIVTLGIALFFLPAYRRHLQKYRKITYHIQLPYCESCLPTKEFYKPITIEGRAYHFRVHKTFKTRLKQVERIPPPR